MKVFFLTRSSYGYQTDYWQYTKELSKHCNVVYVGVESGRKKIIPDFERIEVFEVRLRGNILLKGIKLLFFWRKAVLSGNPDVILVHYWPGCFLTPLLLWRYRKKMFLDIRTGTVGHRPIMTFLLNCLIFFNTIFFSKVSCLSKSLVEKLKLPQQKTCWLPLGAETVVNLPKKFDCLELLYIGTFQDRRLDQMLKGFKIFYREFAQKTVPIHFTVVGDGAPGELNDLKTWCENHRLGKTVEFTGFQPVGHKNEFLAKANIGISFVPLLPCYDCQPPTKTFEYLMAGMPVIATATKENASVITPDNGVLCRDTPEDFAAALVRLHKNRNNYDSKKIRNSVVAFSWQRITEEHLLPILKNISKKSK